MNLLTTEDFSSTFGPKSQRKKPKLTHTSDVDTLLSHVSSSQSKYDVKIDPQLTPLALTREVQLKDASGQKMFEKVRACTQTNIEHVPANVQCDQTGGNRDFARCTFSRAAHSPYTNTVSDLLLSLLLARLCVLLSPRVNRSASGLSCTK